MEQINLPDPPPDANWFTRTLLTRLYDLFRRVRPASGWKDMLTDMTSAKPGVTSPTWAPFVSGTYAWRFAFNKVESLHFVIHLPHDVALAMRDEGGGAIPTKLYPHIHWGSDGVNTGNVRFGFEYTYARGYGVDTFPSSTTIYLEAAGPGTAYTHQITETTEAAALQIATTEPDAVMVCRVFRDGTHINDTLTDDVFIHFVDIHYYSDGLNTNERNRGTGEITWSKQNVP